MRRIIDTVMSEKDDYIFDFLEIENFNSPHSRLRHWFNHTEKNFKNLEDLDSDIFEFGVFRGNSIIAMGFLLKKLGSLKTVYGFDSFSGLPQPHKNDNFDAFDSHKFLFDDDHVDKHKFLLHMKSYQNNIDSLLTVFPNNISKSIDFSRTSELFLRNRLEQFGLNNIKLVVGNFADTIPAFFKTYKGKIFSANMDCDLYESYKIALPFLYDALIPGGFIHLDEYYSLKFPGARIACDEFFKSRNISPVLFPHSENEFERWGIEKANTKKKKLSINFKK
jgi:hypothetical protein